EEGVDHNHMACRRLNGRWPLLFVSPSYHALHHIFPHQYFSTFISVFDLVFGTGCQIRGRTFLVTGATGALGSALVRRLEKLGAIVMTAKNGVDYQAGDYARLESKLQAADVLVLAHGVKYVDCWNANVTTFVDLIDRFVALGKDRLVPPEVWAVGSEIELHGSLGQASMRDYTTTKRAFAARARQYYKSRDLTYRHIVPAAFKSGMGWGVMSADQVAAVTMFLIRRGLRYIPITYTTLAFWNYARFRWWPVRSI
ncbi:MAG TPA: hypothetical protein VHV77_01380, partial [Pirellulales bacterium]|nr:hypothetical protein [Pirellulales bacterium]